ncbi:hypothetical protein RCG23_17320 [Neobacillus sp. PS3-34]|uniref:hypothetical protein n=1 Tax=Neobacillus sp. PS3-34 TaxID=3070678 RepID=UPI0027E1DAC8|nr:hypothetical protein [Neobacillus sp. PS3-34]WML47257.1 hypothetical protein RCG23_17320 [Neobacillus sp. PS3-34]
MKKDLNEPDFIRFCETASPLEMVSELTNGNIRGLEMLALRTLANRRQLPAVVVNVLLVYFFSTFANKVYDRNDLSRMYDYWATKHVLTFAQAKEMTQNDINVLLQRLK